MLRAAVLALFAVVAGFSVRGAGGDAARISTFVPINARVFRMVQPDGTERLFARDDEEPNSLHGDAPWEAELDGRRTLAMTDSDAAGPQQGFQFIDGFLRKTLSGEKEDDVSVPAYGASKGGLAALWPAADARLVAAKATDVWSGGPRIRLWFDNPNKAGLLFAEIALAVLALLFLRRWWWWVLGGLLSLAAFGGLVTTSSRGAFLALLCGLAVLFFARLRSFLNWKCLVPVLVALALAAGWVVWSGQAERLAKNLFREGQRETSRLTIWKEVPRMVVDAPGGWGFGNSARAYIDWYQKKNDCLLKDMISGHITFLVEAGWTLRALYVFFWLSLLLLGFQQALRGRSPVPAAVLLSLGVAAGFNPVLAVPELLVLPVACAGVIASRAVRAKSLRASRMPLLLGGIGTVLVIAGLVSAGFVLRGSEAPMVRARGKAVCVNGLSPTVWIADDDYVLHGGYWWMKGQEIRSYYAQHPEAPAAGFVSAAADLPATAEKIVLVGEAGRDYLALAKRPQAKEILLVSPPFSWKEVPADLLAGAKVRLFVGSVAARSSIDYANPPDWVRVVRGAALYLPDWLAFALSI